MLMWALRVSHSAVVDAWRERERGLRRRGHRVSLVSAEGWVEGGRLIRLAARPGEDVVSSRTIGSHPALFLYDPRVLWTALGQGVDVIDIHEEPFSLAAAEVLLLRALRRQRAPYVLYSAQNIDKRYPIPFRWIERRSLRHASGVNVCSAAAGRIVERKGFPGRARTIDLGTELSLFTPAATDPVSSRARSTGDRVVVGFAGRLDPAKGVDVLLRAVALDDTLSARIAGDGPAGGHLNDLALALGIAERVEFVGSLSQEALPDFYRSVDALAVPSLTTPTWAEQFGRVALEAMACGIPVVVSDSGALPEVVGDAALVVPEGSASDLAKALAEIGRDPEVSARLRMAGASRAALSSWDHVAAEHERLLLAATRNSGDDRTADRPLEVIVVAYGQPELLRGCLAPLRALSITVVDNSSSADVRAVAEAAGARYVDAGHNGGFAAGVNIGLRLADPNADVLLVNPDAVIERPDVERLRAVLGAQRDLASAGPAQVDPTGREARVEWPYPSPLATWTEAVGLGRFRRNRYVIGSVLLLRREALDHVGPFDDERFFLYAEETDWAYRASLLGWRHALVPEARARHVGAATSTDAARRERHFHAAQEIYLRKHFGTLGWQAGRAGQVVGSAVRYAVQRGEKRASARERLHLYLNGPVRLEQRPADSLRTRDSREAPWPP
jgi:glycosyltransferase involved in cell wall biosynthesis/GT2 family glycosyltransferase